jgi:hypothetical protein
MSHLERYMRTHLAGSTAGVDLFDRAAKELPEPASSIVRRIHGELVEERIALRGMITALGFRENTVFNTLARASERVTRLKPSSVLLHRNSRTDLVELESMVVALNGKLAGWESLLAIVDDEPLLDRALLEELAAQAREQIDTVRELHRAAAARALSRSDSGAVYGEVKRLR